MFSNLETNFYIRKDTEDLLWSGISVNTPNDEYTSYKLSCFISRQNDETWNTRSVDFIVFDKDSNMYKISRKNLSQLYNKDIGNKHIEVTAALSMASDEYRDFIKTKITINGAFINGIIDELRTKSEQSFGIKINA